MRNPCKKCIVRAGCSRKCKEYDIFSHKASEFLTFISLLSSSLILGPILLYFGILVDQGEEWPQMVMTILWIVSFAITVILQAPLDREMKTSFFCNVIFGPIIAFCMIVFYFAKPYCQSSSQNSKRWDRII